MNTSAPSTSAAISMVATTRPPAAPKTRSAAVRKATYGSCASPSTPTIPSRPTGTSTKASIVATDAAPTAFGTSRRGSRNSPATVATISAP